jgi:hypothetical protein
MGESKQMQHDDHCNHRQHHLILVSPTTTTTTTSLKANSALKLSKSSFKSRQIRIFLVIVAVTLGMVFQTSMTDLGSDERLFTNTILPASFETRCSNYCYLPCRLG